MPFVSEETGDVVARVVYDGPPEAGKTTNLRMILREAGERSACQMLSPRSDGRKTEYFDWLELPGGFIGGRRVRCQLLSVPGQIELAHRRQLLLETADVIVFVVEAVQGKLEEARQTLALTLEQMRRTDSTLGLVVQANKQDLPGALSASAVLEELGLNDDTSAIAASSEKGDGVMYTFVMAARLAFDRVRELIASEEGLETVGARTPDELLESLLAIDQKGDLHLESARSEEAGAVEVEGDELIAGAPPPLPNPARIAAGHVWPPLHGRQYFARATEGVLRWNPIFVEEFEVLSASNSEGWRVQTFPQDLFETEEQAHSQLIRTAQLCLGSAPWIEPTLALAIYPDGTKWRLWTTHRVRPSIRELLVSSHDVAERDRLLARIEEAEQALYAHAPSAWLLRTASLDGMVVDGQGIFLQAVRTPSQRGTNLALREAAQRVLDHVRLS